MDERRKDKDKDKDKGGGGGCHYTPVSCRTPYRERKGERERGQVDPRDILTLLYLSNFSVCGMIYNTSANT